MQLIRQTYHSPEPNLAADEVMLEMVEAGELPTGALRFWESPTPVVVMGRGTRRQKEIAVGRCQELGIPILRRISGGTAVIAGPGCWMYAIAVEKPLEVGSDIDKIHRYVLARMASALQQIDARVEHAGTNDLALRSPEGSLMKISGNSLRLGRRGFMYHGTLLYNFDLPLIPQCLLVPPREPDYRGGRSHDAFVTNLPVEREKIEFEVGRVWNAEPTSREISVARIDQLCRERYQTPEWNERP